MEQCDCAAAAVLGVTALVWRPWRAQTLGAEAQAALDEQLYKAATAGDAAAVERLAAEGASANAYNEHRGPVLNSAAHKGHTTVVETLLRLGADPDATPTAPDGGTALMVAAGCGHANTMVALLQGGAAVDARGNKGQTALMAAVSRSGRVHSAAA